MTEISSLIYAFRNDLEATEAKQIGATVILLLAFGVSSGALAPISAD